MKHKYLRGDLVQAALYIDAGEESVPAGTVGAVVKRGIFHDYIVAFDFRENSVVELGVDDGEIFDFDEYAQERQMDADDREAQRRADAIDAP